jgi:prevent-host-death family protein
MGNTAKASKQIRPASNARQLSIAEAKANFSSVVSGVERGRTPVTILRRGHPVAQIVPLAEERETLYGSMKGTVRELGDIVGPTGVEWTVGDDEQG